MHQIKNHDPNSPMLIGNVRHGDKVTDAVQKSYLSRQLSLDL